MKTIARIIAFVVFLIPLVCLAHLPTTQSNQDNSLAPMLEKITPSVVNIYVEQVKMTKLSDLLPSQTNSDTKVPVKSYAVGSGIIFNSAKGMIVTNAHVVADQKLIIVTLKNGERYRAKLIAKDTAYDIAVLHIDAKNLTALTFANSDNVKVGDFVTAIGSPYGLSQTVTSGVVSAMNRTHPKIEGYQSFIQTDAPINPGNSGGALVNMKGQLIGINTAIVAPSDGNIGIGFAIPSNMVESVIAQLEKYGKVKRGVLGVIVQNITPELADALHLKSMKGALISQVVPETPAATAGLKAEDVITEIDHHPVYGAVQLRNAMGLIHPGTEAVLTYLRDNKIETVTVTVADPKTLKEKKEPYFEGLRLQDFHELESDGTSLNGVLITGLSDSSNGAIAGLVVSDVITAVDGKSVASVKALQEMVAHETKPLLLSVMRGNNNLFLMLNAD